MKLAGLGLVFFAAGFVTGGGIARAAEPPPGAASCSGCHAAPSARLDTAIPAIDGRPATAIEQQMQAFRTGQRPATIMDRIAKGFTDSEIAAIAAWYASQKP